MADSASFTALYEREQHDLMGYCIKHTPTREDADDIFAETWARAWVHIAEINHPAWLYRVARNLIVDAHRHRSRYRRLDLSSLEETDPSESVLTAVDTDILINTLDYRVRPQFRLWMDGYSHVEIAKTLGISHDMARARWSRAIRGITMEGK